MQVKVLFLALFLGIALAANVNKFTIDNFAVESGPIIIVTGPSAQPPTQSSLSTTTSGAFTGERDVLLVVEQGNNNLVFSASVSQEQFDAAAPQNADGYAVLQYDGQDGSITLNPNGASSDPNRDFTKGNAFALHLEIEADQVTTVEIYVYSGSSSSYCKTVLNIPGDETPHSYVVDYSDFSKVGSGCDFTRVGALELLANLAANVDIIVTQFATFGPQSTTKSPSPSRTRTPSRSRTPKGCQCNCNHFHCVLEYDPSNENTIYFDTTILHSYSNPYSGIVLDVIPEAKEILVAENEEVVDSSISSTFIISFWTILSLIAFFM